MNTIKSKYRGKKEYFRVKAELIRTAEYKGTITYKDVAVIMGLPLKGQHMATETGHMLGEISKDEVEFGRPMLSSVVVDVKGKIGQGYFRLADELKLYYNDESDDEFWRRQQAAVYKEWKRQPPKK